MSQFCNELAGHLESLITGWSRTSIRLNDAKTFKGENSNAAKKKSAGGCRWCVKNGRVGQIITFTETYGLERAIFRPFTPENFVTAVEEYFDIIKHTNIGPLPFSLTSAQAKVVLASDALRKALPTVEKILFYSLPIGIGKKPSHKPGEPAYELVMCPVGFGSYVDQSGDIVHFYCHRDWEHFISLSDAKKVLECIYQEFSFETVLDKTFAIAHLLTPYCQSLIGWRKKAPIWLFTANSPRSGKDYLAMISPIIHEGVAVQDPPVEEESELKRRITSAIVTGRRFQHFANCRGELDSPSLEAAITSEFWSDRMVGSSAAPIMLNEIIFSMSYNGHLPITQDLQLRARRVVLKNPVSAKNKRTFTTENLHSLLAKWEPERGSLLCRRNVLAALQAIVTHWVNCKRPAGGTFTSFPEWGRIVGGIMEAAGLGDPTAVSAHDLLSGMSEEAQEWLRLGLWHVEAKSELLDARDVHSSIANNSELFPILSQLNPISLGKLLASWSDETKTPTKLIKVQRQSLSDPSRPKYRFIIADELQNTRAEFAEVLQCEELIWRGKKLSLTTSSPQPPQSHSELSFNFEPPSEKLSAP
jgi:hypothetical protein